MTEPRALVIVNRDGQAATGLDSAFRLTDLVSNCCYLGDLS